MIKQEIPSSKGPTKDYLQALLNYPNYVKLLDPKNKNYEVFYHWVLSEALAKEESKRTYSIKEVATQLNIKASKVTTMIHDVYEDIFLLNEKCPDAFKNEHEILCLLHVNYFGRVALFYLGLNFIPRIGENFEFTFLKPKLNNYFLYVNDVSYEITGKGQLVTIDLKHEAPNKYVELIKEKAFIYNIIGIDDYILLDNKKMANKLKSLQVNL